MPRPVRSAAGTTDKPGRNVWAQSGLDKSILVKAGRGSVASLRTKWRGSADGSLPCRRRTQAAPVQAAAMWRPTTDARKRSSGALSVAMPRAPTLLARRRCSRDAPHCPFGVVAHSEPSAKQDTTEATAHEVAHAERHRNPRPSRASGGLMTWARWIAIKGVACSTPKLLAGVPVRQASG